MGRSSYSELAQILKTFLEKIIKKLENEAHQLEGTSSYNGMSLDLQKQIEAINTRIADVKNYTNKLNGIQRCGQKKIETKLPDGSKLLQVDSQLSGNMHNIQTMNEYANKVYYNSTISSADGRICYEESLVDGKEAGKVFTELKPKVIDGQVRNVVSYYEEDVKIPNTGSKTKLILSVDGEPPMRETVNDENKDIRIKVETEPERYYRREETTPILDKNGKQIGMRTSISQEEPMGAKKSDIYREVYDSGYGQPPRSIETRVNYDDRGGITSAWILEDGKMIQNLRKNSKGEIKMRAFDRNSGEYIDGKYPLDAAIMVYGGTNDNHFPSLALDIEGETMGYRWKLL